MYKPDYGCILNKTCFFSVMLLVLLEGSFCKTRGTFGFSVKSAIRQYLFHKSVNFGLRLFSKLALQLQIQLMQVTAKFFVHMMRSSAI